MAKSVSLQEKRDMRTSCIWGRQHDSSGQFQHPQALAHLKVSHSEHNLLRPANQSGCSRMTFQASWKSYQTSYGHCTCRHGQHAFATRTSGLAAGSRATAAGPQGHLRGTSPRGARCSRCICCRCIPAEGELLRLIPKLTGTMCSTLWSWA